MLAATDMTCRVKELEQEVVVFNPKKEVIALVAISWAFQIITLCVLIGSNVPDPYHALCTSWEQCARVAASCTIIGKSSGSEGHSSKLPSILYSGTGISCAVSLMTFAVILQGPGYKQQERGKSDIPSIHSTCKLAEPRKH